LGVELVIVAQIQRDRSLVDDGGVAETGPDRVDAAFERAEFRSRARIAGYLAIVIADDAQHEPLHALKADRPLPMKLVSALVAHGIVLEVEGEARRATHLQLGWLVRPGKRPARIDARAVG